MSGVHAVVLAAGAGERFGGGKLTTPWRGGLLIDGALDAALAAPVDRIWVTVGADAAVAAHLQGNARITLVEAPRFADGLSASLKAGVAALPPDAVGALVFLGDMPRVPHAVLEPLVRALEAGAPAAVPVFDGRRGHPAALGRALFPAVLALEGDRGAGALLDALGDALVTVTSPDAGVMLDVDSRADLRAVMEVS